MTDDHGPGEAFSSLFDDEAAASATPTPPPPPTRASRHQRNSAGISPSRLIPALLALWLVVAPSLAKRRVQVIIAAGCVVLAVAGTLLIVLGSTATKTPPRPPAPQAAEAIVQTPTEELTSAPAPVTAPTAAATPTVEPTITATGSTPIRITVPAIGVDANIIQLGLNKDKTVQVPALSEVREAGWYKYSPVPGAVGPSIILGHIDSAEYGAGVFFKLGEVKKGNMVTVLRADHMLATFSVTSVAEYAKTAFPTSTVYGNTSGPALRLITCGGRFDSKTGSYLDNIVVFGNLVSLTKT